ncbi:MAG TPA: S24/S26 family peptidase [Terriglobales bacterium]|nr:S24/S26 family peptidase [Terriglobales bacterium]
MAAQALRRFGELRLRVSGSSMLPALWPGDLVVIRSAALAELSRGDLVLFLRQDRFFVHRVLAVSGSGLLTRGDALSAADPPVSSQELLGRVVSVRRNGRLLPPLPPGWLARTLACIVRHSTRVHNLVMRLRGLHCRVLGRARRSGALGAADISQPSC